MNLSRPGEILIKIAERWFSRLEWKAWDQGVLNRPAGPLLPLPGMLAGSRPAQQGQTAAAVQSGTGSGVTSGRST